MSQKRAEARLPGLASIPAWTYVYDGPRDRARIGLDTSPRIR